MALGFWFTVVPPRSWAPGARQCASLLRPAPAVLSGRTNPLRSPMQPASQVERPWISHGQPGWPREESNLRTRIRRLLTEGPICRGKLVDATAARQCVRHSRVGRANDSGRCGARRPRDSCELGRSTFSWLLGLDRHRDDSGLEPLGRRRARAARPVRQAAGELNRVRLVGAVPRLVPLHVATVSGCLPRRARGCRDRANACRLYQQPILARRSSRSRGRPRAPRRTLRPAGALLGDLQPNA
jgi:hypothetical protein